MLQNSKVLRSFYEVSANFPGFFAFQIQEPLIYKAYSIQLGNFNYQ